MSQTVVLAVIVGVVGGLTGAWLMKREDQRDLHHRRMELNGRAAASASKPSRRTLQQYRPADLPRSLTREPADRWDE